MKRRWKTALAAVLAVAGTVTGAGAAQVAVDDVLLAPEQGWVEDGTSYITLRAFAEMTGAEITWDGNRAGLDSQWLELTARPGELYITANGRVWYVEGGVQAPEGTMYLPLRLLAQVSGMTLGWDGERNTARLDTKTRQTPEQEEWNEEDLYWLSRIISAESRGEPLLGQIAVGNVVLNRVASSQYPNTVREVVFDRKYGTQFEPVDNGTVHMEPTASAVLAARLCLNGASVVGDCLYFFAPELSAGSWIVQNRPYYTTIGCHRFYR